MSDKSYRQIVVLSGKGGTGKTTLSAALAKLINKKNIIDCDVDAANLHLVLKPEIMNQYDFSGGKKAVIEPDKCDECGLCKTICRFDAIKNLAIDQISCEGCGFCFRICPNNAITFTTSKSGVYFECKIPENSQFYYARLNPGEGNSGKLVSEIKRRAEQNIAPDIEWIVVDGPPGIGCPVNASIAGADYAVIVTEPTLSGIHDLKRLIKLLNTFKVMKGIVINKFDLNKTLALQIDKYAEEEMIPIIGVIPFNPEFMKALIRGNNIVEVNEDIRNIFTRILRQLELQIEMIINN